MQARKRDRQVEAMECKPLPIQHFTYPTQPRCFYPIQTRARTHLLHPPNRKDSSSAGTLGVDGHVFFKRLLHTGSVRRSSLLDWKKDQNRTEPNCKRLDHQLRLHKFWIFSVASCDVCQKIEKPKESGLLSHHVLDLTHAHSSLIVGLWIIKNGQELVEI